VSNCIPTLLENSLIDGCIEEGFSSIKKLTADINSGKKAVKVKTVFGDIDWSNDPKNGIKEKGNLKNILGMNSM
jgi:hypothetical protein